VSASVKRREFITLIGSGPPTWWSASAERLAGKYVNHYVTDGEVTAASLMVKMSALPESRSSKYRQ